MRITNTFKLPDHLAWAGYLLMAAFQNTGSKVLIKDIAGMGSKDVPAICQRLLFKTELVWGLVADLEGAPFGDSVTFDRIKKVLNLFKDVLFMQVDVSTSMLRHGFPSYVIVMKASALEQDPKQLPEILKDGIIAQSHITWLPQSVQAAITLLTELVLGTHDIILKSIVANHPTGSYRMRIKDQRIKDLLSKVP